MCVYLLFYYSKWSMFTKHHLTGHVLSLSLFLCLYISLSLVLLRTTNTNTNVYKLLVCGWMVEQEQRLLGRWWVGGWLCRLLKLEMQIGRKCAHTHTTLNTTVILFAIFGYPKVSVDQSVIILIVYKCE